MEIPLKAILKGIPYFFNFGTVGSTADDMFTGTITIMNTQPMVLSHNISILERMVMIKE